MKTSEILIYAKHMIASDQQHFICHCFQHLHNMGVITAGERSHLQYWLMEQLDHRSTYGEWLGDFHPKFVKKLCDRGIYSFENLSQGRLAWLDYLIARQIAHEKKGKK